MSKTLHQRVLVTGSNGLVGTKLVERLKRREDLTLFALSKGPNRIQDKQGYKYFSVDITDTQTLKAVFKEIKPQAVFHTAAMTQVDQCEREPEKCYAINVEATRTIAQLCKTYEAYLLFLSTDFVFDGKKDPYDEKARVNPLSVYARSKVEAEGIVRRYLPKQHCIVRTSLVYGYAPHLSRKNIVLWVRESLLAGKTIRVVIDQYRTPTFAEDLAEGCIAAFRRQATGTYHIAGLERFSIYEMAQLIADHWKLDKKLIRPTTTEALNQPAKRPAKSALNIFKAQVELDYRPHRFKNALALIETQLNPPAFPMPEPLWF